MLTYAQVREKQRAEAGDLVLYFLELKEEAKEAAADAQVCSRMLTYADIIRCMLTYAEGGSSRRGGTQFTCSTGTKVQIQTPLLYLQELMEEAAAHLELLQLVSAALSS
jgi:hypothetical protein